MAVIKSFSDRSTYEFWDTGESERHCPREAGITPEMAIRLAKYSGNSEQFRLNLQDAFAVYHARKNYSKELKTIKTLAAGAAAR